MKKKTVALTVLSLLTAGFCALGAACSKEEGKKENGDGWTVQTVYAKAQELGYEGSLEEFIELVSGKDGENGKDGVGIKSVAINEKGELIVELTAGDPINCGKLPTAEVAEGSQDLLYVISEDESYYTLMGRGLCADRNLVIPSTYKGLPVKEIGEQAFYRDDLVTSVIITENTTKIDRYAFTDCSRLTSVTLGRDVQTLGERVFENSNALMSFSVNENNAYFKAVDGNLYSKDGKTFVKYANAKTATEFVVPAGVTRIEEDAFRNHSLECLTIAGDVETIADSAVYCRNLSCLVIGKKVKTIEEGAFAWDSWKYQESVFYCGSAEDWTKISGADTLVGIEVYFYVEKQEDVPTDGGKYWRYDENGDIVVWE